MVSNLVTFGGVRKTPAFETLIALKTYNGIFEEGDGWDGVLRNLDLFQWKKVAFRSDGVHLRLRRDTSLMGGLGVRIQKFRANAAFARDAKSHPEFLQNHITQTG